MGGADMKATDMTTWIRTSSETQSDTENGKERTMISILDRGHADGPWKAWPLNINGKETGR